MDWFEGDVVANGVRLHYIRAGKGTPVLLLHDVAESGRCWGRTADVLVQEHELVLLDQRGHGRSESPTGMCTPEILAMDAAAVIRELGVAPAAVVGHSLGALAALALAARCPNVVTRLVLEDPPLVPPERAERKLRAWLQSLQVLSRNELIEECREASPAWSPEECVNWAESKLQVDAHILRPGCLDLSLAWEPAIRQICCPMLLVYGDVSCGALLDTETSNRVSTLLRHGEITRIAHSGHSVHRDDFAAFIHCVQPFLHTAAVAMAAMV